MLKKGITNLPLHYGKAPKWLFKRMVKLSKGITEIIIHEYGKDELLRRLSNPYWFQALSCVLGYDWHSSGTTTVTCGALKEAIDPQEYGFMIAGGKGNASRRTIQQIEETGELYNFSTKKIDELKYSSRMAAKVDNNVIQDGYKLYHHVFLFTEDGLWSVIQQGINTENNYARRYHWLSEKVDSFVCGPNNSIIGIKHQESVLDMAAKQSDSARKTCIDIINDNPIHLKTDWAMLKKHRNQRILDDWMKLEKKNNSIICQNLPRRINWSKIREIYDIQPRNYEELIAMKGIGPNIVRALALISDLIYGDKPSWQDPIKYSFTVGGKDGVPFPVDRKAMDESTEIIKTSIEHAKIGNRDKIHAIKRLREFISPNFKKYYT